MAGASLGFTWRRQLQKHTYCINSSTQPTTGGLPASGLSEGLITHCKEPVNYKML